MCIIHEAANEGPTPLRLFIGRGTEATPPAAAGRRRRSGARGGCSGRRSGGGGGAAMADVEGLLSVDYEVYGKVQGVFFRKYTQGEAKRLGLVGWVQNTSHGTVQGQIQGPAARVRELQEWLRKIGSPQSRISRAEFNNEKKIEALEHKEFQILK
ncbi:acylphosphatase-1 [Onychostruthus taczanowskii]|uniref:acylphosphatase-1 n=1 Tax=Onychostruthus taczanowskii TaxID=356909 RepID=UPI001B804048|nr:acylphosphatase-1 [Onychostruthus taczanowskii]